MTLTVYQLALIAGGFTLAGMLIGALLTNHFAEMRDKKNRIESSFAEAANKFRRVIAEEIAALGIKPDLSRLDIIQVAIIEFKPYLSDEKKKQIEEAWGKYKTLEYNRSSQANMYGYKSSSSISKQHLEDILKFTENYEKNS